tara:strand:- start:350 stop:682 length:333 start_codon:yes stop_codon:yes gene_type:complete
MKSLSVFSSQISWSTQLVVEEDEDELLLLLVVKDVDKVPVAKEPSVVPILTSTVSRRDSPPDDSSMGGIQGGGGGEELEGQPAPAAMAGQPSEGQAEALGRAAATAGGRD